MVIDSEQGVAIVQSSLVNTVNSDYSPIFLQFMDCVYQMAIQWPNKFEFNTKYLSEILYHTYSLQFGTFLFDSVKVIQL